MSSERANSSNAPGSCAAPRFSRRANCASMKAAMRVTRALRPGFRQLRRSAGAALAGGQRLRNGVDVDRDRRLGVIAQGRRDRQRIEQPAVDEQPALVMVRADQRRNRDRGADRVEQRALGEPHLALLVEIDRDGRVRNRQFLDVRVADEVAQHADDAVALDEAAAGEGPVEQAQHVQALQRLHPVRVALQLAGRVDAADQGAHRAARDRADRVAARFQFLDHADVRVAARAAGAEHERDLRAALGHQIARCMRQCGRFVVARGAF